MEVLALQAFVSLALVAGSLLLFGFSARQRDHEHADRLALAPLDDDTTATSPPTSASTPAPQDTATPKDPSA